MIGKRYSLMKLKGIPVVLDISWFLILALLIWQLSSTFFPIQYPGFSERSYFLMGIFSALLLFASILIHELAHALVIQRFGVNTKRITLFIFGGVAEIKEEPPGPKAEFWTAIAGPIASVSIGIIAYACYIFLINQVSPRFNITFAILDYLWRVNFIIAVFNLIPAFPLDGGRILRSIIWKRKGDLKKATKISASVGAAFGVVLMILGVVAFVTGNFIGGMWYFLIGTFLRWAAAESYSQVVIRKTLEGESIKNFMTTKPITVNPYTDIEGFVENYVYRYGHKLFPVVTDSGHLVGCVSTRDIKNVPRSEWKTKTIGNITRSCDANNSISVKSDVLAAFSKMSSEDTSRLIVIDENKKLAGIITLKDIMRFITTRLELESEIDTEAA